jgi:transcriptional regulator of arginine metabolism
VNRYSTGETLRRREQILALVRSGGLRSQEELQRRLRGCGISVAQPTLSRDLRALGLAKTAAGYTLGPEGEAGGPPPAPGPGAGLDRVLREFALAVQAAGTLVVVRTPPATAPTVARVIDEAALPDAVGSIAGDDTIFLATPGPIEARRLARRLSAALAPSRRARA